MLKNTHICSFSYNPSDRVLWCLLYERIFVVALRRVIRLGTCRVAGCSMYKQDRYTVQQYSIPLQISGYVHWAVYRISYFIATLFESRRGRRQSCLGYCDVSHSLKISLQRSYATTACFVYLHSYKYYVNSHCGCTNWFTMWYIQSDELKSWRNSKSEMLCKHGSDFHGLWVYIVMYLNVKM